jgi:hypothetical protein
LFYGEQRLLEQHWSRKSGFALDRHDVFAAPLVVGSKGDQPTPNSVRDRTVCIHLDLLNSKHMFHIVRMWR